MPVAYTNHIGHSSRDTHSGKGTAISTLGDLGATERHNNHDYTEADVARLQSDINLELKHLNRQYIMVDGELTVIRGHLDLEANVRRIYEEEFSASVAEYNQRQIAAGHPERQIESYIDKISADQKQEVAVEGLIQIGSLEDWEGIPFDRRMDVIPILERALEETLAELNKGAGRFVLAGASLHLNEGSPHLHYVGVPLQETPEVKNGLKKRVKKTAVFNKESLGTGLQDNVRAIVEPLVQETFGWTFAAKKTGRNEDRDKRTQVNVILQAQIEQKQAQLSRLEDNLQATRNAAADARQDRDEALAAKAIALDNASAAEAMEREVLRKISQANEDLKRLQDDAAEQELTIAENDAWLSEQAELMGLYQTRAEYLDGGQKAQQAMDDIQEDLDSLPVQHKLFRAKDAESWRQRTTRRLQSMMEFVKDTIGKLQIFEKEYPDEAPERLSKPTKKRAVALDDVINAASAKAGQSYATRDQLDEYYGHKDSFWLDSNESVRVARAQYAEQSEEVRWYCGQYAKAQYLVKNSDGFVAKGIAMIGVWVTGADLARERKREQEILKTRDDLAELCREAISLDAVQKDARRRNELTEDLERQILEHQDSIIARLKEIREKQGFRDSGDR